MKRTIFTIVIIALIASALKGNAQTGYITTIAGGKGGYGGDGGPATAGKLSNNSGICIDKFGNIYIADQGNNCVRKVDTAGIITTYAGTGVAGFSGDGGPASAAKLNYTQGVAVDDLGNVYVADENNNKVRKIDPSGIITTFAGLTPSGFSGDGGPVTSAQINDPSGVATDHLGNVYICDRGNCRIRKVNALGIISTVAGSSGGYGGDGGPATLAQLLKPQNVSVDNKGNIYIADFDNKRIRKVNTAGIITTIAGTGVGGYSGDGGPATAAKICNHWGSAFPDGSGNIYIADLYNNCIRKVDNAGIITTIAGSAIRGYSGDGGPATAAKLSAPSYVVPFGADLYISAQYNNAIRKISGIVPINIAADSFSVNTTKLCNGPQLLVSVINYGPGMTIKTDFGDATTDISPILTGHISGGYAIVKHTYNTAGTYTITQVLYKGSTPVDTIATPYTYTFCRSLPVSFFYDANSNCTKDPSENNMLLPTTTVVDSNGTRVATLSATSGFSYNAYGNPGDVYSFKLISSPGSMSPSCPSTGTWSQTLTTATPTTESIGYSCGTTPGFDLNENISVRCGRHFAQASIIINNKYCTPKDGIYTMHFSPKYTYSSASPTPLSVSGSTITWSMTALSSVISKPVNINVSFNAFALKVGDTVNSDHKVDSTIGDVDTSNNYCHRQDTIKSSFDPNQITAIPAGNILSCTPLRYTVEFENTGNDTAHNIYVMDTLPQDVDVNSLRIVTASAAMNITILKDGIYRIARFDFPDINLLDSSHHNECHGMVIYDINANAGLADGTKLHNHAGIFFDDNEAVLTNICEHTIGILPLSGKGSTCIGTTDTLTNATAGGVWTASNTNATVVNGVVTGVTSGSTTISYTVSNACTSQTKTKVVTIGSAVAAPITGTTSVCAGATSTLSSASTGGIWSSSNPAVATISSSGIMAALTGGTTTISYTVTNACGSDIATTTATVLPLPSVPAISGIGIVCIGTTDTLTNATPGGVWTASNTNATVVNGAVTGVTAGSTTISYTVTNACASQTKTKVVTIGSVVAAPISGPSGVCLGSTITLTDATTGGVWKSSKSAIASISSSGLVTGLIAGTSFISYTVTNACGSDVATVVVTVYPLPAAFTVLGGGSFCSGGAGVHLGLSSSKVGVNYQAYMGATKVGAAIPGIGGILDLGIFTAPGIYTVVAENATTSCTENMTGSASVAVDPTVVPGIIIVSTSDTVCSGNAVTYMTSDVNGGIAPTFQWNVNGVAIVGATGATYSYPPATGDVVSVLMKSSATCALPDTTSSSVYPTVIASLLPTVLVSAAPGTHINKGESITLTAAVTDAGATPAYQWIVNGNPIIGATMPNYTYDQFADNDSVACLVTSSGECGGHTSFNATIIHVSTVGVRTVGNTTISIYPNPVSDELTITTEKQYNSFTITNSIGQVMMEQPLSGAQTTVSVKALPAGMYYISLRGSEGVMVQKFVKM